jgi:hypothetical protein
MFPIPAGLGIGTKIFRATPNMSYENSKYFVPQEHQPDGNYVRKNKFMKVLHAQDTIIAMLATSWQLSRKNSVTFRDIFFNQGCKNSDVFLRLILQ